MQLKAALCLDGLERPLSAEEQLSQQLQMILSTRPGQVPWRKDFGCQLNSLVGEPATGQNLNRARIAIETALDQFLPDVEVLKVDVRFVPRADGMGGDRHPTVPVAESALLSLGVQVGIEVQVEVKVPRGSTTLSAQLEPSNL